MSPTMLVTVVLALSTLAFWQGKRKAFALSRQVTTSRMHSRPGYYGMLTALWCAVPALVIVLIWQIAADPLLTRIVMDGVREAKGALSPDHRITSYNVCYTKLLRLHRTWERTPSSLLPS